MTDQQRLQKATRNLFFFTGGEFIGTIGAHIYMFGISFFVLTLTGSASSFALTFLCSMVPRIILAPIAGHIVDRLPRKQVVVTSHALMTATMLLVFIYTLSFGLSLPVIYITAVLIAIFATFAGIGLTASVASFVDGARIQRAISLTQSSNSLASILGPVLGGVMYGFLSIEMFFLIHAIAYATALICEININFSLYKKESTSQDEEGQKDEPLLASLKAGAVYVKGHRVLLPIMLVALWVNFFFMAAVVGLPYVIIEVLGATSNQLGLVESMIGLGTLALSVYLSTRKEFQKPIRTMRFGMISIGFLFALLALPLLIPMGSPAFIAYYMAVNFLFGAAMIIINTPIQVLMQKTTPEHYRGRVFGLLEMVASGISPIGLILFGFLYDIASPALIILITAGLLIAVTVMGLRPSKVDDEAAEEVAEEKAVKIAEA
ncbi:MFS transporter [Jeotgalibacillus haloalkalitolerans]|uniref:MFS transporter n=1 Tax=Jeotgalibacillus haloalkalitolerans TaxID=3104292 RepID=A0ABU5KI63_9BACL|nr:MFS transporter [Jeotgalibacillus sp. HH7-29]MDZ5710918.1 MFS transporter [Jeotgalibacillus sp. HH7-29]